MTYEDSSIIPPEFIKQFLYNCDHERHRMPRESAEGSRIADQFRKLFPDVSDKDLGTIIVVFVRAFTVLAESNMSEISGNFQTMIASYSYSAAEILKAVSDLNEL